MMRWGMALLLVGACTGQAPDPALVAQRKALDAWDDGRALLEQGSAAEARAAFSRALDHQPADPLILAWRARAEASAGELRVAIATLDTVLAKEPGLAEARYNRAAYLARLGDVPQAAAELRRALLDGAADPRDVLLDEDFAPHLERPELSFLPQAPLEVRVKGPGGTVFVGSDATVRLVVEGLDLDAVDIEVPAAAGPLRLTRAEERLESLPSGDQRLTLTWTLRAVGAGRVPLGPFVARAGSREAEADGLTLVTLAPEDHDAPDTGSLDLERPRSIAATAPEPAAWAWRAGGRLLARTEPGQRVELEGEAPPDLRALRVVEREEAWTVHIWNDAAPDRTLRLRRGGNVLDEVTR